MIRDSDPPPPPLSRPCCTSRYLDLDSLCPELVSLYNVWYLEYHPGRQEFRDTGTLMYIHVGLYLYNIYYLKDFEYKRFILSIFVCSILNVMFWEFVFGNDILGTLRYKNADVIKNAVAARGLCRGRRVCGGKNKLRCRDSATRPLIDRKEK